MAEYIKREDMHSAIEKDTNFGWYTSDGSVAFSKSEVHEMLNTIPSADVVEVKTAHWVRMSEKEVFGEINMQCSECAFDDWRTPSYWKTWGNFCPNCGADMRGGT